MKANRKIFRVAILSAILSLVADQFSKWALLELAGLREDPRIIPIVPFFNLVMRWNQDTSFNLIQGGTAASPYILSLAALVIVGLLVLWLRQVERPLLAAAIGAVIGGALGNVVDRLRFGAVADFFDAYIGDYHWPAFNIADSLIVVGVGILVLDGLFGRSGGAAGTARGKRP